MKTILDIKKEYNSKIDPFELDLLIAHSIGKSREFILTNPEFKLESSYKLQVTSYIRRRQSGEPVAYITGHKEFYGLDFEVNKHTLIPRPETEALVETLLQVTNDKLQVTRNTFIVDIGTGSGNIIISIAKAIESNQQSVTSNQFFAIDISKEALKVAKQNAKKHEVDKNIKFLHGNLLNPLIQNSKFKIQNSRIIILANLPYLSKEVFDSAPIDVKKFEPKSALYSPSQGLAHYEKLFKQIKKILLITDYKLSITVLIEFSPEQKEPFKKIINNLLPKAQVNFKKDLAGKWRIATIEI